MTETYGPRTKAWRALTTHAQSAALRARLPTLFALGCAALRAVLVRGRRAAARFQPAAARCRRARGAARARRADRGAALDRAHVRRAPDQQHGRPPRAARRATPAAPISRCSAYGENVMPLVEAERAKMRALADALHSGELRGFTGKPITDIVNIGIGGSDLGIVMAVTCVGRGSPPGARRALRLERRRRCARARIGARQRRDDVVRDLLEDLHDARDARQRAGGPRVAARRRRQGGRRGAMRGRVDE